MVRGGPLSRQGRLAPRVSRRFSWCWCSSFVIRHSTDHCTTACSSLHGSMDLIELSFKIRLLRASYINSGRGGSNAMRKRAKNAPATEPLLSPELDVLLESTRRHDQATSSSAFLAREAEKTRVVLGLVEPSVVANDTIWRFWLKTERGELKDFGDYDDSQGGWGGGFP